MIKYSIEEFVRDCESFGWRKGQASPMWMDMMDLEPSEDQLEKVLMYYESEESIPHIMDCKLSDSREGVYFRIGYMSHGRGSGIVTNKEDLVSYMKVAGFDEGAVPKNLT